MLLLIVVIIAVDQCYRLIVVVEYDKQWQRGRWWTENNNIVSILDTYSCFAPPPPVSNRRTISALNSTSMMNGNIVCAIDNR
jgi:hypothetical protein